MLAHDMVSNLIPAVTASDTVGQVVLWMSEFKVDHLPVVDQGTYVGLLTENNLREIADPAQLIGTVATDFLTVSVQENQHIYEVIDLISRYKLTLLPVLDMHKDYLGSITLESLVWSFDQITAAGQPGAILVLSLAPQDYSPTMISRILEDNLAKMISLYAIPDQDSQHLKVTIKVNTQEISSIIRSFDRYGYVVRSYYMANSEIDEFYRARYEEFMKYMNI